VSDAMNGRGLTSPLPRRVGIADTL